MSSVVIWLVNPKSEYEKYWTKMLDHIAYVGERKSIMGTMESFVGIYQCEAQEANVNIFISQNQSCQKISNQASFFAYPISDTVSVLVFKASDKYCYVESTFSRNNQGKVFKFSWEQWNDNTKIGPVQFWKEDSLILRAKDLLESGPASEALSAFRRAYDLHPEHYYLANFIKHLEIVQSPEYGSLESAFDDLTGEFGDVKLYIEDERFYYTNNRGLIYRLLPLEEDRFMVPSIYTLQIHMIKEEGAVTGMTFVYRDGREEFYPRI